MTLKFKLPSDDSETTFIRAIVDDDGDFLVQVSADNDECSWTTIFWINSEDGVLNMEPGSGDRIRELGFHDKKINTEDEYLHVHYIGWSD